MANPNPVHKFEIGEVNNPLGAPKKELSMTNALRDILTDTNPETKIERYKELLNKALSMAMRGDGDMLKYLINRIEGMPKGSETQIALQVNNIVPTPEKRMAVVFEHLLKNYNNLCPVCLEQIKKDLNELIERGVWWTYWLRWLSKD